MANKVTKKDNFNTLLSLEQVQANAALVAFINHEIELLDKKAENRSTKPTVRQAENAEIKSEIVSAMEKGKHYRCAEVKSMIDHWLNKKSLADWRGFFCLHTAYKTYLPRWHCERPEPTFEELP